MNLEDRMKMRNHTISQKLENLEIKEVLFTSEISHTAWNSSVWDPANGTNLVSFKEGHCDTHCMCPLGRDYLVGAMKNKPLLKFWRISKKEDGGIRFAVPGVVNALDVSPSGEYCVGSIDKKLYVWEVSSGKLHSVVVFHQQAVNCVKFTSDGMYFVSAGLDSAVVVWDLDNIFLFSAVPGNRPNQPVFCWKDHTSEVTDVFVCGGSELGHVFTASRDQTCRVYSLAEGILLFSVYADVDLTAVVIDQAECFLCIGASNGDIHQVKFYSESRNKSTSLVSNDTKNAFLYHELSITCLAVSYDNTMLASGAEDGKVVIWDIAARHCLKTIKHSSVVTNVFFMRTPPGLYQSPTQPTLTVKAFERVVDGTSEISQSKKLQSFAITDESSNGMNLDSYTIEAVKTAEGQCESSAELQVRLNEAEHVNTQLYTMTMNTYLNSIGTSNIFEQ